MTVLYNMASAVLGSLELLFASFLDLCAPHLPDLNGLLQWALTSSVLILAVLLLRLALRRHISCRVRYALWAVVLARLLLPFQLPLSLPYSAADIAPEAPVSWEQSSVPVFPGLPYDFEEAPPYYQQLEPGYLGPSAWSFGYVQRSEDGQTMTSYIDMYSPERIVQSVWWTGSMIFAAVFLISNLHFHLRLCKRRRPAPQAGIPLPVYTAQGLPSPCLFGLFRPAIYLTTEAAEDATARRHVLAHELTHHAHLDHIWSVLRCLCLALHWYNPLVWLAAALSKRDGELACDEGAIKRLGEEERLSYGRTLLNMVARRKSRPADLLSCSTAMAEGKKPIQQRIQLLVKRPETVKTALFTCVAVVVLAAVFTFSSARADHYRQFCTQLDQAQSIAVHPPLHFSVHYPDPITDEDLLAQAKALLADPQKITASAKELESSVDFSDAAYTSYRLTLDQNTTYYLYSVDEKCYVLLPRGQDGALPEQWHCVAALPAHLPDSLFSLARTQYNRSLEAPVPLTAEELAWFNDGSFFANGEESYGAFNLRNQFLSSYYDRPEDIDLYQLFYCSCGNDLSYEFFMSQEEYQAVYDIAVGDSDPIVPCLILPRAAMDAALLRHTGLTLEQTNQVNLDFFTYLPEYDVYYLFRGDTNYTLDLTFTAGTRNGDVVHLYYTDRFGLLDFQDCVLTLIRSGDSYHFYANQPIDSSLEAPVPLTQEELDWFNQGNFFNNGTKSDQSYPNLCNQFLTSFYHRPEDIDLYQLFYNGSGLPQAQEVTTQEWNDLPNAAEIGIWPTKNTTDEINEVLQTYMGLTLDQTSQRGLEYWIYLPQYDAYYAFHGDTNSIRDIRFTSGFRLEDMVTLFYQNEHLGLCAAVLREAGDRYQFYAHRPVPPDWTAMTTLEFMENLEAIYVGCVAAHGVPLDDVSADPEELVRMIRQSASQTIPRAYDDMRHGRWTLALYTLGSSGERYIGTDNLLTLSVGNEENTVCLCYQYTSGQENCHVFVRNGELYQTVRSLASQEETSSSQTEYLVYAQDYVHALTTLFLENKDARALNQADSEGSEYDIWLNDPLSSYTIRYMVPLHHEQACWCALARSQGGSSYQILIPDSMVDAVLGQCRLHDDYQASEAVRRSPAYIQLMETLLPMVLDDQEMMDPTMDSNDSAAWEKWTAWLDSRLGQLGLSAAYHADQRGYFASQAQGTLTIPQELLSRDAVLSYPFDPTNIFLTTSSTDPQAVAELFAHELTRRYLALDPRHPKAVTFAQFYRADIASYINGAFTAHLNLAVDPVEVSSLWWAAGSALDPIDSGSLAGHYCLSGQYRLVQETDGVWHCTAYEGYGSPWGLRADGLPQGY